MKTFLQKYLFPFLFCAIIAIAFFFRFYQLQSVPPSASLDEVTIGWNAYSLLLTGKDEYGYHLPLLLRAYDDYRPALYVYMVIPFIKLLGLSVLAVRLPSAILSMLTVIGSFFFVKILLRKYTYEKWVSLSTMVLLAISPYHIYISRLGHEANPGLTFAFLGAVCFLWAVLSPKRWLLIGAAVLWGAAFYTYQSEKVFVPLLVVSLSILFAKELWENKKVTLLSLFLLICVSLPIFFASLTPGALLRLKGTSVFADQHPFIEASLQLAKDEKNHNLLGELLHNRRLVYLEVFASNYLPHFNPTWWVTNANGDDFKAPSMGLAYMWELPLLLLGIVMLLFLPLPKRIKALPCIWILIAFVAPGISTQTPHAMRSYNILPMPQVLEGVGVIGVAVLLKNISRLSKILSGLWVLLFTALIVSSIQLFSYAYFVLFPVKDSNAFQYALHSAIRYVTLHQNAYDHIVISNRNNAYQSYMFYLFDTRYNPSIYQAQGGTKSGGYEATHQIGNITFRPITKSIMLEKHTLYIGNIASVTQFDNPTVLQTFTGLAHIPRLIAFTK